MEGLRYIQSLQRMLQENASLGLSPDAATSLPVAVMQGGRLADAVFFFEADAPSGNPFAWSLIDTQTGQVLLFARRNAHDFMPQDACPPEAEVFLTTPQAMTPIQKADGRREILALYEQVRTFAFAENPTPEQRQWMERFALLFESIAYVGHRPFYRALAPDFLGWLGLELTDAPQKLQSPLLQSGLEAAILELSELFREKIMNDDHKQRLFDEMHRELQLYKKGLIDTLTRPMEGDIIKLIDDIEKSMNHYRGRQFTPDNYRRLLALFEGVGTDLEDLLYRHGLEPFSQEGRSVVVGRQKVLATLPTDKPRQDKKIAVRHSKGWEKNGNVVRPERVTVYIYTPPGEEKE